MRPEDISKTYAVRRLTEHDLPAILALCRTNPLFYKHCPPNVTEDSIRADMQALPPGKTPKDKYYLGYFDGNRLAAVLDLILGFPNEETAFIGFFMVDAALQGRGVGSALVEELCCHLKSCGFAAVRLGWVQGNPQSEHFWHKNNFKENGARSKNDTYTILYAQRGL